MFQSPNNRAMISSAPRARAGGAAGMLSTARQVGQTLGAALVSLIFTLQGQNGTHATLLLSVAVTLLALAVSGSRMLKTD